MGIFKKESFCSGFLLVSSLTCTLMILEIIFRVFHPIQFQSFFDHSTVNWMDSSTYLNNRVARPSNTLGYEWIPNTKYKWVKINSLGMLDSERQADKAKNVYRIICIGDSTTANSMYAAMLEKMLNENLSCAKFEVWNCGVIGYAAMQYCRALEEKWLKYDPDVVIIGFCLNDFATTPLIAKENDHLVGYFPQKEILPLVNPLLLKHSALYRFIIEQIFFKKGYTDFTNNYEANIEAVGENIIKIKELLLNKKVKFLLVILGLTERIEKWDAIWQSSYKAIKKIVDDYHIDYLDMVPIFEDNGPENLMNGDMIHFNQKGSQLISEKIFMYLKKEL